MQSFGAQARGANVRVNSAVRDDLSERLWRLRRRHAHIDGYIREERRGWTLRFVRNGRLLFEGRFTNRDEAVRAGRARVLELERAGWNSHW
jgi:hypothetical protein